MVLEGGIRLSDRWTESDIAYLREHFPNEPAGDIADVLGCSDATVRDLARKLGIEKSPSFMRGAYSGRYVRMHRGYGSKEKQWKTG